MLGFLPLEPPACSVDWWKLIQMISSSQASPESKADSKLGEELDALLTQMRETPKAAAVGTEGWKNREDPAKPRFLKSFWRNLS